MFALFSIVRMLLEVFFFEQVCNFQPKERKVSVADSASRLKIVLRLKTLGPGLDSLDNQVDNVNCSKN